LTGIDLDDLAMAGELVLKECHTSAGPVHKQSGYSETLSTAAPSSAEQSPELACMASEIETWPSLREAESGWDFCSESSDIEEFWEDLPEPALAIEGLKPSETAPQSEKQLDAPPCAKTGWWIVPEIESSDPATAKTSGLPENEEATNKLTFAALVRDQLPPAAFTPAEDFMLPPAAGTLMPAIRTQPVQRRNGTTTAQPAEPGGAKDQTSLDDEDSELYTPQRHGWKKEHKGSWNTKQQRKGAQHKARRIFQSCQSRGWLEDGPQD